MEETDLKQQISEESKIEETSKDIGSGVKSETIEGSEREETVHLISVNPLKEMEFGETSLKETS